MSEIYKSASGRQAVEARYRRALDRWPVPREELMAPTSQGDTFIVACGERSLPPLVLLHGSGANSASWLREVAAWATNHRVYAVDMIGEPGFSAPSRPRLASGAYVEWLDEVFTALQLPAASIAAISLGGWLGLMFAVHRPGRVASLSLISPSGIGRQDHLTLLKLGLLRLYGRWGLRRSLQLVSGGAGALPPQAIDSLLVVFEHFKPRMEPVPLLTDAELRGLRMPVQVIVGSEDVLLRSSETRERVERLVPHARVTCLEGVGHIVPPQTTAVAEFLATTTVHDVRIDAAVARAVHHSPTDSVVVRSVSR